jgi:hypothetical protein
MVSKTFVFPPIVTLVDPRALVISNSRTSKAQRRPSKPRMVLKLRDDPSVSIIHSPETLPVGVAVAAVVVLVVTVEVVAEVAVAAVVGLVTAVAVAAVADLGIVEVVEEAVAVIVEGEDEEDPGVVQNQEGSLPLRERRLPSKSLSSSYYAH